MFCVVDLFYTCHVPIAWYNMLLWLIQSVSVSNYWKGMISTIWLPFLTWNMVSNVLILQWYFWTDEDILNLPSFPFNCVCQCCICFIYTCSVETILHCDTLLGILNEDYQSIFKNTDLVFCLCYFHVPNFWNFWKEFILVLVGPFYNKNLNRKPPMLYWWLFNL